MREREKGDRDVCKREERVRKGIEMGVRWKREREKGDRDVCKREERVRKGIEMGVWRKR